MAKPKMSESQVRKSLVDWQKKQHFRYGKWRFYLHKSKRPLAERRKLIAKWERLAHAADDAVKLRRSELAWYRDHQKKPSRQLAVEHALAYVGTHESPAGSNEGPHITGWERACAGGAHYLDHAPWCGIFAWNMLHFAGVSNLTPRMASVGFIEDDAKAKRYCYRGWTTDRGSVQRGDLVVLFGYGVHVEIVERVDSGGVWTIGGNTSSGNGGSQANGGMVAHRYRPFNAVRGFALINYPG